MRGMDVGLVFAIIFAIVFIGLLMVFGFGQITNMFCFNGVAQVDKAVKDLDNEVQTIYNLAEGSGKPFRVNVPSGSSVCIINVSNPVQNPSGYWLPDPDKVDVILDRISARKSNVWINYNCGTNDPTYEIANVVAVNRPGYAGTGSFCATSGQTIYLENAGDRVTASLEL